MLVSLKINNIAIIEESEIQFRNGLNILTGETGAGKSIIIDALNFVLGARADKGLIKNGKDFAKVEGVFEVDVSNQNIIDFCESVGIECEDTIIITRFLNAQGKNEIRVNGALVTLGMLKNLTSCLVDIYGQHEHQALLDVKSHLRFLDLVNNSNINDLKMQLKDKLENLKIIEKNIKELGGDEQERSRLIDILRFQIEEIENAKLYENEEEELIEKKNVLSNAEKLYNRLNESNYALYDSEESVQSNLKRTINSLQQITSISEKYEDLCNRLNNVKYEIEDISAEISDALNSLTFSESEINEIEERFDLIKNLKRKYGSNINAILEYAETSKKKLESLENCAEEIEKLEAEKIKLTKEIFDICEKLTFQRRENAHILEKEIMKELVELGMKNATFKVGFDGDYTISDILDKVQSSGADNVEFLFSANLGEPVKSLNKIISGGEMSRFMLAFKCVLNTLDYSKTFVFDEIDAGIGGAVGVVLAKKMAKISKNNQVICITHLPQIASFANIHFKIQKFEDENKTVTSVKVLNTEERILELARMLGGDENAMIAKEHAKELLESAESYKKQIML